MAESCITSRQGGTTFDVLVWDDLSYHPVCRGVLERFPGSDQMWVSHSLETDASKRRLGHSLRYHDAIVKFVREHGGRAIVATVHVENKAQHVRLENIGWKRLSRTLWMFVVTENEEIEA